MPDGKPAGVRCIHLTIDLRCALWGKPERPEVCDRLMPNPEMCGEHADDAMRFLEQLERTTRPDAGRD